MIARYLVVGLGNPGPNYEGTRHNIGARVVKRLAEKQGWRFRSALAQAKGSLSEGELGQNEVTLLLPLTYMNESGGAVQRCLDYFEIDVQHLLVVVDDVALPFGQLRLRGQGSSGGHNGLKSIAAHLQTQEYARLRVGVGQNPQERLADYVLGRFSLFEQEALLEVIDRAVEAIVSWIVEGLEAAMRKANEKE